MLFDVQTDEGAIWSPVSEIKSIRSSSSSSEWIAMQQFYEEECCKGLERMTAVSHWHVTLFSGDWLGLGVGLMNSESSQWLDWSWVSEPFGSHKMPLSVGLVKLPIHFIWTDRQQLTGQIFIVVRHTGICPYTSTLALHSVCMLIMFFWMEAVQKFNAWITLIQHEHSSLMESRRKARKQTLCARS